MQCHHPKAYSIFSHLSGCEKDIRIYADMDRTWKISPAHSQLLFTDLIAVFRFARNLERVHY